MPLKKGLGWKVTLCENVTQSERESWKYYQLFYEHKEVFKLGLAEKSVQFEGNEILMPNRP